jgi:hypothetical protein
MSDGFLGFVQACRRDFVEAGEDGYYRCAASHNTGRRGARRCILARAQETEFAMWDGYQTMDDLLLRLDFAWRVANHERVVWTNTRGYEAAVAAYDRLIIHLESQTTTTNPQEVTAP